MTEIATIRQYIKNARSAIESGQVTDKDVHGTLTKVIAMLDALDSTPAVDDTYIEARIKVLSDALKSISKNTCCDNCREAALVARSAIASYVGLAREGNTAAQPTSPSPAVGGEPVAWQFRQRSAVGKGPQSSLPWCDWCGIEREDYDRYVREPNPLIQVRPLYAAQPASPLRGREDIARLLATKLWAGATFDEAQEFERTAFLNAADAVIAALSAASPLRGREREALLLAREWMEALTKSYSKKYGQAEYKAALAKIDAVLAAPPEQPAADPRETTRLVDDKHGMDR